MKNIYFLILLIGFSHGAWSQSKDQNYIKTTEYQYATNLVITDTLHVVSPFGTETLDTSELFSYSLGPSQVKVVYFDGLGRPKQEVIAGSSTSEGNIVKHIGYEVNLGKTKDYLPYSTKKETGSLPGGGILLGNSKPLYESNAEQATLDFYNRDKYENTTNPYSEVVLEASPLKKVLKQAAPGNDWKVSTLGNNHNIDYQESLNVSNQVKKFTAKVSAFHDNSIGYFETILENQGYHTKNTLYWNSTKDENGVYTDEFKDVEGKILAQRMRIFDASKSGNIGTRAIDWGAITDGESFRLGTELLYTYYVYDDYGNLNYVLPPLSEGKTDLETLDKLCYQYKYDYKNRMVAKKLPAKEWEYLVYDKIDRLVATGPVYSPFGDQIKGWVFTKYDVFSRVLYSGFFAGLPTTAAGRKQFETELESETITYEAKIVTATSPINGVVVPYSNLNFPKTDIQILSINYYDDYTFDTSLATLPTVEGVSVKNNVKGLPTGNWTRVLTKSSEAIGETSYSLYDAKNRVVRSYLKNYLEGFVQTDVRLNFRGLPIKSITTHAPNKASLTNGKKVIEENFTYNNAEQLISHTHKVGNGETVVLTKNNYDNLRVLTSKEVGAKEGLANSYLQKVTFAYNIRGWLTQVNSKVPVESSKPSLFTLQLNYNKIEDPIDQNSKPLYNGNIAQQIWRTTDGLFRSYTYEYDDVNRLKNAVFQYPGSVSSGTSAYNEQLTYDLNGNIKTLKRSGADSHSQQFDVDDLEYSYSGNQLQKVTDASGNASGFMKGPHTDNDFTYDTYGNLISDKNKKITQIKYNHLNLPVEITMTTGKINYIYNAAGVKVQKTVIPISGLATTTDYLGAFQYENNVLQFFPTTEGYYNAVTNKYVYQYQDHLGNTRVSYSDTNGDGLITTDEILGENNYYPFGLKHQGDSPAIAAEANKSAEKYKYNGKELQDELGLGLYDYGARNYDAALGRWFSVDPLAEVSRRFSPYVYGNNNPIRFIDPDGMAVQDIVGGKRYTGEDAQAMFSQLKSQYSSNQNDDDKKKDKDKVTLSGAEQVAIGLRNYGGDYSDSAFDWTMYSLDQLNQFNPIANIWDGITGSIDDTDRFGNPQSDTETGLKYVSVVPVGKVTGAVAKALGKVELAMMRKGMAMALANPNNISHIMQAKHGLDGILKIAGSERNVVRRLFLSLGQQSSLPASGTFERIINVYGKQVTVRGAVVDGTPRIATAFIP